MTYIPKHAERVDFDLVFKLVERPSKFLPGVMAKITIIECPACHTRQEDTNKPVTCQCGLSMAFDFGGTFIWRDAPAKVE